MNKSLILTFFLILAMSQQTHAQASTVSVRLKVPDGGWKIQISQVYQTRSHLLAVSELKRHSGPAIQVISEVKDSVKVRAPKLPVQHFVLGKTWNWPNKGPYTFVSGPKEFSKHIAGAKLIYQANLNDKATAKSRYIVVYKKEIFSDGITKQGETLHQLAKRHCKELGGSTPRVLGIINGFAAEFPTENLSKLKTFPEVKYVEKDR